MAQLTCSGLSLGYERRVICAGLSFSVNEGDYLCIVGENGSGKTTLMKTILGLQKPLAGSIAFGDGLNDLTMIETAGTGVAMANACPEVLAAADFVTLSNDEDGVAKTIEQMILSKA